LSAVGAGNNGPAFYGEMMDRTVKASSRMGLYLLGSLILSGIWARFRRNAPHVAAKRTVSA
jgi:hypothetical protein